MAGSETQKDSGEDRREALGDKDYPSLAVSNDTGTFLLQVQGIEFC